MEQDNPRPVVVTDIDVPFTRIFMVTLKIAVSVAILTMGGLLIKLLLFGLLGGVVAF